MHWLVVNIVLCGAMVVVTTSALLAIQVIVLRAARGVRRSGSQSDHEARLELRAPAGDG